MYPTNLSPSGKRNFGRGYTGALKTRLDFSLTWPWSGGFGGMAAGTRSHKVKHG